jgi:hypothetical protein
LLFQCGDLLGAWVKVIGDFDLNLLLTNMSAIVGVIQLAGIHKVLALVFPLIFLMVNVDCGFDLHGVLLMGPKPRGFNGWWS